MTVPPDSSNDPRVIRSVEANFLSEHLVAFVKNVGLAIVSATSAIWIAAGATTEEWRLAALALGGLTAIFALASAISLLSLCAGVLASVFAAGMRESSSLLRFYLFQRLLAAMVAAVFLAAAVPLWWMFGIGAVLPPVVLGLAVAGGPAMWGRLREQPWFYRTFRSGKAPAAEFAQGYHLKRFAKPFRSTFTENGGHCAEGLFIGTSTRESS